MRAFLIAISLTLLACSGSTLAGTASAATGCDRLASPSGDDSAAGTPTAPVRTVAQLFAVTGPGQRACLEAGQTFNEVANITGSGTAAAPIELVSSPGEPAVITGQIRFVGSHIHVSGVDFGGLGAVAATYPKTYSLGVDGNDVHIEYADITSPMGTCVDVGSLNTATGAEGPQPADFKLEHSRVHGCGLENLARGELTKHDSGLHGVELVHTIDARILDDAIYGNADRGIQLWPDADGTVVAHDVLDGNGSNLNLGAYVPDRFFTENTLVRDNVISNSVLRSCASCDVPPGDTTQIVGYFPSGQGTFGNVVENNCIFEADPSRNFEGYGYLQRENVYAEPQYLDAPAGDYGLQSGSPCGGYGLDGPIAPAHLYSAGVSEPAAPAPAPTATAPRRPAAEPSCPAASQRRSKRGLRITSVARIRPGAAAIGIEVPAAGSLRIQAHGGSAHLSAHVAHAGRLRLVLSRLPRQPGTRLDATLAMRSGGVLHVSACLS